jgi:hypothetical protein
MPNNSQYKNYSFWHPNKLTKEGPHTNAITLKYFDGFVFKLKKYGRGKYNKYDILKEDEISVEEFEEIFQLINKNIIEKVEKKRKVPKLGIPDVYIIPDLIDD